MKNSTLRKIIPSVCKLIVSFLFFFNSSIAQISPGDLTNAHVKYEGISNCTKCHVLGKQVQVSKCLDCHAEIKKLINENRGYHSGAEARGKECWNCHSEHHGRNFRIINFNNEGFDHSKAGFILTGRHSEIKCVDCHKSEFIQTSSVLRKNSLLGLSQSCKSCHIDIHQGRLGEQCNNCHNTTNFSKVEKFDHTKTRFKLTGAHINVTCLKCHPSEIKNGKQTAQLTGIPFSSCESCHKDVHAGQFGKDCQSCHVTSGFKIINQKNFDHNKTSFPLLGKHLIVNCSKCHGDNLNSKPRHQNCSDCHSDYHNGEFTRGAALRDCSTCHTENGYEPSIFTIDEHNRIDFKLVGAHLAVPCRSCHFNNDKWHFRNIGSKCIDCHKNVHGTEITVKFMQNNNCEFCHNIDNWKTVMFNHSLTTFPLEGKHKNVSCGDCHYKEEDTGNKIFRFISLSSKCEGCHKDVHVGQFIENGISNCGNCHTFDTWKPEKFNHSNTRFSLEGAHQKLACSKCHPVITENNNQFIKYKLDDFKCAACH